MKRKALIAELEQAGCYWARSSGKHDVYKNPANGKSAPISRHTEISNTYYQLIRKQLEIESEED